MMVRRAAMTTKRDGWRPLSRITPVLVIGLAVVGCSSPPTADDLTRSILRAAESDAAVELSNEEAACIAEKLVEADFSETTLTGLAENFGQPTVLAREQADVELAVYEAALSCSP